VTRRRALTPATLHHGRPTVRRHVQRGSRNGRQVRAPAPDHCARKQHDARVGYVQREILGMSVLREYIIPSARQARG